MPEIKIRKRTPEEIEEKLFEIISEKALLKHEIDKIKEKY